MGRTFGDGHRGTLLSQREVAARLDMTRQRVDQLERRALRKLARHPVLVRLARENGWLGDEK